MYKLFAVLLCAPFWGASQILDYTPNRKLNKTIAANYYNTEFIFIQNISNQSQSLNFDLVDNTLPTEWSATICTNQTCYSILPKSGSLGALAPGEEAYISLNLAVNGVLGEGNVRYLVSSLADTSLHDTVTFNFLVTEDGTVAAGPWANLNFSQGVITVLLADPNLKAHLFIYTLDGKAIYDQELNPISSVPIRNFGSAAYLVYIRDEYDRMIKKKIVYFSS